MNAKELAKKPPMGTPGFKTITPKAETEYDRKIQEEQERQMADCCGDGLRRLPYDRYGYKPRPQNPPKETPVASEPPPAPAAESQDVPQVEKKNNKR